MNKEEKDKTIAAGGWGWPGLSKKSHYFTPGELMSLCRKWLYAGPRELGNDGSLDNCAACKQKFRKLNPPKPKHDENRCMLMANLGPNEADAVCTCLVENDHVLTYSEVMGKVHDKREKRAGV